MRNHPLSGIVLSVFIALVFISIVGSVMAGAAEQQLSPELSIDEDELTTTATGSPVNYSLAAANDTFAVAADGNVRAIGWNLLASNIVSHDLAITKTAASTVVAGENLTYTLTISNIGTTTAFQVEVTDNLPAGVSFVSAVPTKGSCSGGPVVTCNLGSVANGTGETVTIVVTVLSGTTGSLMNTASVASTPPDSGPGPNNDSASTTVQTEANMEIIKSGEPNPVGTGSQLTYTLNVNNLGPSNASGVVVTDLLPLGLTASSATASQGTCGGTTVVICTLGSVNANAGASVTIVTVVPPTAGPTLHNEASVGSLTFDPFEGNNTDPLDTDVVATADMEIIKGDENDPVGAGEVVTYTIDVINNGLAVAAGVVVTDQLPMGMVLISPTVTTTLGTCSIPTTQSVFCSLGDMAANTAALITLTAVVDPLTPPGNIRNRSYVGSLTPDDDMSNNDDSARTTITAEADLAIEKIGTPDPVTAGLNLTYVLTATNLGPAIATNVAVSDILPPAVTWLSTDTSQGSCGGVTTINCSLGNLTVNATATITIVVNVPPSAPSTIQNTATISGDQDDPTPGNDTAVRITSVNNGGDIPLSKLDTPDPVVAGAMLTYTLNISNSQPSMVSNVVATDTLPLEVGFMSATPSQGTCEHVSGVVRCELGNMAVGGQITVEIVTEVFSSAPEGQINNMAIVTASNLAPGVANQNTQVVAEADLSIQTVGTPNPVNSGGLLTYVHTVHNQGQSDAAGVLINNTLPPGVTFNSSPECSPVGAILLCSLGNLPAGANGTATIVVNVLPSTSGLISNTATVFSGAGDPDTSNNTAVETTIVGDAADLQITKTAIPSPVNTGEQLEYRITVTNLGSAAATNVTVIDTLPIGVSFVSATSPQGSCTGTGSIECNLGTIVEGDSGTVNIIVDVLPLAPGTLQNVASVSSDLLDPDTDNNVANVSTTVVGSLNPIFMPVFYFNNFGNETHNDACEGAFPIVRNLTYQFLPENPVDWYQFDLPATGNLGIGLSNFLPMAGQVAAYRGDDCTTREFLGNVGIDSTTEILGLGMQPAGHYYIFVGIDGPLNDTVLYRLRVGHANAIGGR